MSPLKLVGCLSIGLLGQRLVAQETAGLAASEAPTLHTSVRVEERLGRETVRHACFSLGEKKFALVLPPGFRLDTATNEKIVLVNKDFSCLISIRIVAPVSLDERRESLLTQYPGAKILTESSATAAGQSGPAFDLQCNKSGIARAARVAFIPSPAGVLEFTLMGSPNELPAHKTDFDFLLLTLRTGDANQELQAIHFGETS